MSSSDDDFEPLPPPKRRRINRVVASPPEDDDAQSEAPSKRSRPPRKVSRDSHGSTSRATSVSVSASAASSPASRPSRVTKAKALKEKKPREPKPKKPKHRMITYQSGFKDDEDIVATQVDSNVPSSPSRIRGARYIKEAPALPPKPEPVAPCQISSVGHSSQNVPPGTYLPPPTQVPDHTGVGLRPGSGGGIVPKKVATSRANDTSDEDEAFTFQSTLQPKPTRHTAFAALKSSPNRANEGPPPSQQLRAIKLPPMNNATKFDEIESDFEENLMDAGAEKAGSLFPTNQGKPQAQPDFEDDLLDDWDDDPILSIDTGPTNSLLVPNTTLLAETQPTVSREQAMEKPPQQIAGAAQTHSEPPRPAARADDEFDEFDDFDIEAELAELADLPSDAFEDSSPYAKRLQNKTCIEISSSSPAQPQNKVLVAPKKNLQQRTLWGSVASQEHVAATQGRQRNYIRDAPPEPPTHHKLNEENLHSYVYPTNLGQPRDYQYSIVSSSLFANTLVALPTGLGKTFIAATVMLNWYRWTKSAQIVFVAPTRPLVSQQVAACFSIVGIPASKTSFMTGGVPAARRAEEWRTKRVFFCTPQIYQNDLKTGHADPKRLVLLVVDEAHRATGKYSYVQIVELLRKFNSSFRILALTATPGSNVKAVQDVIDGLDIARIEIRTEDSIDIRPYIYDRDSRIKTFNGSDEMELISSLLKRAMAPIMDKLCGQNAYWTKDPLGLSPYGIMRARREWMETAGRSANPALKGMMNGLYTILTSIATSIELFKYHGLRPFYHGIKDFRDNVRSSKSANQLIESQPFRDMMTKLQYWCSQPDFVGHPKLQYLLEVVHNHFLDTEHGGSGENATSGRTTRVMVFAQYRSSAEEIVKLLRRTDDMIKPHVFVGQAASKGSEGMDQKTQLSVIEKFKSGVYNVLVATSIGEEGLDIGEIDLIICYDTSASPVRMLQRMGRTGRKRAGRIHLLMMTGKEEQDYYKAVDSYKSMQKQIANGNNFVYHDERNRRIVPREIKPKVEYRDVDIPPENKGVDITDQKRMGRVPARVAKAPAKKFHIPEGVATGFSLASGLGEGRSVEHAVGGHAPTSAKDMATATSAAPSERKRATANLVGAPTTAEVLLTPDEQRKLNQQYQSVHENAFQNAEIEVPSVSAHYRDQAMLRPTGKVPHGRASRRFASTMSKMRARAEGGDDRPPAPRGALIEGLAVELLSESEVLKKKARAKSSVSKPRKPQADSAEGGLAAAPKPRAKASTAKRKAAEPRAAAKAKAPTIRVGPKASRAALTSAQDDTDEDDDDRMGGGGSAAEGASSSPPPTDPRMALPTQGEWLGSDTSGSDASEEEADSELRDFIVEADDDDDEDPANLPSSIPLSSQRVLAIQREAAGQPKRRLIRAGPKLFTSDPQSSV